MHNPGSTTNFSTNPLNQSNLVLSNSINPGNERAIGHAEINGQILFYVTDKGIYRADSSLMVGSTDIELDYDSDEVNVCLMPGETDKYYIFHKKNNCSPLYYSIVDMSLSGGTGGIVNLNTLISNDSYAEGIETVRIPGTVNYWFIAYKCSTGFETFEINSSGIQPGSMILMFDNTATPPPFSDLESGELDYHNGKIAFTSLHDENVAVFDFNAALGTASNLTVLNSISLPDGTLHDLTLTFGLEFSPDASKLYISRYGNIPTLGYNSTDPYNLYRYDFNTNILTGYSFPEILDTMSVGNGLGQIEIGPDGNLYSPIGHQNYIFIIENPNDINFTYSLLTTDFLPLSVCMSDHIQSDVYNMPMTIIPQITDATCSYSNDGQATIYIEEGVDPYSVSWETGQTGFTETNLTPGTYSVYITDGLGNQDSTFVTISSPAPIDVIDISITNVSCPDGSNGSVSINQITGGSGNYTIDWFGVNTNSLSVGNYPYLITDDAGCVFEGEISIDEELNPNAIITSLSAVDSTVCLGDPVDFIDLSFSELAIDGWLWEFGDGLSSASQTPSHIYSSPGVYDVTLSITNTGGCVADTTLINFITVNSLPEALFSATIPPDNANCDLDLQFLNFSLNYEHSEWVFGDNQTSYQMSPNHTYDEPGNYTVQLRVISEHLCDDTTYLDVTAQVVPSLFVPNAFTPNDDRLNDVFSISGNCFESFEMWVYNRWGSNVFYTNNPTIGWNGELNGLLCPSGSYTWKATYKGEQGRLTKHGVINLIR